MRLEKPRIYDTQFLGKAAEHAVAAKFLLRGIPVHFPVVDEGADLIVGGRIRIQVKARRNKVRDGYTFTICGSRPRNKQGIRDYTARDWSKDADFIVCWGVTDDRYWIVPTVDLIGKNIAILCFGFGPHWTVDHEEVRALHQAGMKGVDIARQMGCSPSAVSAVLLGRIKRPAPSFSTNSSRYENAWHLIDSAIGLTESVDEIDGILQCEKEFK